MKTTIERWLICVALGACDGGAVVEPLPTAPVFVPPTVSPATVSPATVSPPTISPTTVSPTTGSPESLVVAELLQMNASTAADLIPGAPARAIVPMTPSGLYGAVWVTLALTPGAPGNLPVQTELSMRFSFQPAPGGGLQVFERPARDELRSAVQLLLDTEAVNFQVAIRELEASSIELPEGAQNWTEALRTARLDPRLPRATLYGEPTWQFLFDPFREPGGYPSVLLDAHTQQVRTHLR